MLLSLGLLRLRAHCHQFTTRPFQPRPRFSYTCCLIYLDMSGGVTTCAICARTLQGVMQKLKGRNMKNT